MNDKELIKLGISEAKACDQHCDQYIQEKWMDVYYNGTWSYEQFMVWRTGFLAQYNLNGNKESNKRRVKKGL